MTHGSPHNLPLILSPGTKIVLRGPLAPRDAAAAQPAGAVGVIIKSPPDAEHSYRVRFVDGSEAPLRVEHPTASRGIARCACAK